MSVTFYFEQVIADQLKSMSSTINEYKTTGLTLMNTAQRYIDIDPIENEITSIGKQLPISKKLLI